MGGACPVVEVGDVAVANFGAGPAPTGPEFPDPDRGLQSPWVGAPKQTRSRIIIIKNNNNNKTECSHAGRAFAHPSRKYGGAGRGGAERGAAMVMVIAMP